MGKSGFKEVLERWAPVFRIVILAMICTIAVLIRVFSVIRFESIIHEFDPWFNFRSTKFLTEKGLYEFWNWFDAFSWFPLGRVTGGTVYPGIMTTAAALHSMANYLTFPLDIRNVCVFLAPIFSAFTALACYLLTKEITGKSEHGLFGALFISVVPSYISRSVAGSYDNEGIAIFALVFTFYLFIKASKTGSLLWSGIASLSFFYMVAAWGGYAFIINLIPIYMIGLILIGKFSTNMYIAYCSFHILGSLLAMQIPFVGFQAVTSSEHLASHTVFIFINIYFFCEWVKENIGEQRFNTLKRIVISMTVFLIVLYALYVTFTGKMKWSGRSLSLLDPTYAKKFIPIIASVSEHQPTTWSSFFFDLHILTILAPLGLYYCLVEYTESKLFIALYAVLSVYFASVMVRLLLVLAPALCVLAGIGISETLRRFARHIIHYNKWWKYHYQKDGEERPPKPQYGFPLELSVPVIFILGAFAVLFIWHSVWAGAQSYSSPSIILSSKSSNGDRIIVDDYREAYYWLRMNTKADSKIMSWWDYGYQITGMANRTVLVDNNTWNNTHIATVGMIFGSGEEEAAVLLRKLDVNYVLVLFGGYHSYSGDDINKFLWMIRIASGVFSHIKESNYKNNGSYRVDSAASETLRNCLMYKLCYYRFGEVQRGGRAPGYDVVRRAEIGEKNIKLKHFKEAFTTKNWIFRIYELLPDENRENLQPRSDYSAESHKLLKELSKPKIKFSKE